MGENYQQKLKKFKEFEFPYKLSADDFKIEDKRLFREVMLDDIKKIVVEAFGASSDMASVGQHVRDSLEKAEGGKWFAAVSFNEQKLAQYWSHQEVKLTFDRYDENYTVMIAQMQIDRQNTKNVSSKLDNNTSLKLTVLPVVTK